MISFKFAIGGQDVFVQADNAVEAVQILSAISPAKVEVATPVVTQTKKAKAAYPYIKNAKNAPRAWQRWTLEEVRILNENKNLKMKEIVKIPALEGRNRSTLVTMRSILRTPERIKTAPTNFRKFAEVVMATEA